LQERLGIAIDPISVSFGQRFSGSHVDSVIVIQSDTRGKNARPVQEQERRQDYNRNRGGNRGGRQPGPGATNFLLAYFDHEEGNLNIGLNVRILQARREGR
jgi:hypothetical protein